MKIGILLIVILGLISASLLAIYIGKAIDSYNVIKLEQSSAK